MYLHGASVYGDLMYKCFVCSSPKMTCIIPNLYDFLFLKHKDKCIILFHKKKKKSDCITSYLIEVIL